MDNIQKARSDSIHNAIRTDWNGKFHVSNSSEEIEKLVTSLQERVVVDMTKQACSEAQNDLTAYYKVGLPPQISMSLFSESITGCHEDFYRQRLSPGY
jgi:hypothetical protein